MKFPTIRDIDLKGQRVLLRAGFDIPPKELPDGRLVPRSDLRLKALLPTIRYLLEQQCAIIFLTWVKRPDGKTEERLRTKAIAERLSEILNKPVAALPFITGNEAQNYINNMKPGDVAMLENVRFDPREIPTNDAFSQELAEIADTVVIDCFSQIHRDESSITGLIQHAKRVAVGFDLVQELQALDRVRNTVQKPFTLIFGGIKISDKITTMESLIEQADNVLIGGAMANLFLKAEGVPVGASMLESSAVVTTQTAATSPEALATKILRAHKHKIVIPHDAVVCKNREDQKSRVVDFSLDTIAEDEMILDIGPKTIRSFSEKLAGNKTIFWNGALGLFEKSAYENGTKSIAQAVSESGATSILAGGDTVAFVEQFNMLDRFTHLSNGGGASLMYLSGKKLPGLQSLENRFNRK